MMMTTTSVQQESNEFNIKRRKRRTQEKLRDRKNPRMHNQLNSMQSTNPPPTTNYQSSSVVNIESTPHLKNQFQFNNNKFIF